MTVDNWIEIGWLVVVLISALSLSGSIRNYGRGIGIRLTQRTMDGERLISEYVTDVTGLDRDNAAFAIAKSALMQGVGQSLDPPTKS
tara:strand:- start:73 stop:333 length:261 start_codon:yes stop_codon:yes gene_type:complete